MSCHFTIIAFLMVSTGNTHPLIAGKESIPQFSNCGTKAILRQIRNKVLLIPILLTPETNNADLINVASLTAKRSHKPLPHKSKIQTKNIKTYRL